MHLIANWRAVLLRAWSMRLMFLAALLSAVEVILPFFPDAFPHGVFAAMSGLVVAAAFIARIVAQRDITKPEPDPYAEPFGEGQ